MTKDDDENRENSSKSYEDRRNDNLAEYFRQNPPPSSREKPEHTEGINFDDIINENATGGIAGADETLSQWPEITVNKPSLREQYEKIRRRVPGESSEDYHAGLLQWVLEGARSPLQNNKIYTNEGLMALAKEFYDLDDGILDDIISHDAVVSSVWNNAGLDNVVSFIESSISSLSKGESTFDKILSHGKPYLRRSPEIMRLAYDAIKDDPDYHPDDLEALEFLIKKCEEIAEYIEGLEKQGQNQGTAWDRLKDAMEAFLDIYKSDMENCIIYSKAPDHMQELLDAIKSIVDGTHKEYSDIRNFHKKSIHSGAITLMQFAGQFSSHAIGKNLRDASDYYMEHIHALLKEVEIESKASGRSP